MNNKKLITADIAIRELIGNWLLWALILHFINFILIKVITDHIKVEIIQLIFALLLHSITIFYIWKISTEKTLKNKMFKYNELSKIMKGITIFTIIICIIMAVVNFYIIGESFEETINEAKKIDISIETIFSENEKNNFKQNTKNTIIEVKHKIYTYLISFQILVTIIYLYMVIVEKKRLLNYIAIDQDYVEHINNIK